MSGDSCAVTELNKVFIQENGYIRNDQGVMIGVTLEMHKRAEDAYARVRDKLDEKEHELIELRNSIKQEPESELANELVKQYKEPSLLRRLVERLDRKK